MANTKLVQEAVRELLGDQVFVVITKRDVFCRTIAAPVSLWADCEKTGEPVHVIKERGTRVRFSIIGWPKKNGKGIYMIPVLWESKNVWVDMRFIEEVKK